MADTEQIEGDTGHAQTPTGGGTDTADSSGSAPGGAPAAGGPTAAVAPHLDRSRSRLRLPIDLLPDARRLAVLQSMPDVRGGTPGPVGSRVTAQLQDAGILSDGTIDPVAHHLLEVVNNASLIVTVELSYGDDQSEATVWATPRQAVLSSTLEDDHVDYQPVSVSSLPQTLAQMIVLQSPKFVGDVLLEIDAGLLDRVRASVDDADAAAAMLIEAGLADHQAALLVTLQADELRRWRIESRWSTEDGPESAEMVGVDGGPSGQWLIGAADPADGGDRVLYSPQGHGEVMSSFRQVLPKNWLGTPLNPPPV
ncbi:MAG: hypothetical protein AAF547_18430 [Actinomycetota bacterium]